MSMMVHMRRLNRVHRTHHADAEPEHREVSRPSTQTERIVVSVVNLAKSGQEEQEGTHQRDRDEGGMPAVRQMPRRQRSGQPRGGDQGFVRDLGSSERQQIAPLDATEPVVPELRHAGSFGRENRSL